MPKLPWPHLMAGLNAKNLKGNIYQVPCWILGESEIGPYDELLRFVKGTTIYKLPVDVHHIVNGEHLGRTGWVYETAPCIVLSRELHQQYHARFSEILPEHHGRDEIGPFAKKDKLALYYDAFVDHTGWVELWTISARILTGSLAPPNPKSFLVA